MNFVDRSLAGNLRAKLREIIEQRGAELLGGAADDYADYRARAAYIQALRDVEQLIQQTIQDITGRQ